MPELPEISVTLEPQKSQKSRRSLTLMEETHLWLDTEALRLGLMPSNVVDGLVREEIARRHTGGSK